MSGRAHRCTQVRRELIARTSARMCATLFQMKRSPAACAARPAAAAPGPARGPEMEGRVRDSVEGAGERARARVRTSATLGAGARSCARTRGIADHGRGKGGTRASARTRAHAHAHAHAQCAECAILRCIAIKRCNAESVSRNGCPRRERARKDAKGKGAKRRGLPSQRRQLVGRSHGRALVCGARARGAARWRQARGADRAYSYRCASSFP